MNPKYGRDGDLSSRSNPQKGEIMREPDQNLNNQRSRISVASSAEARALSSRERSWKSGSHLTGVIESDENNDVVYNRIVAPIIPEWQNAYHDRLDFEHDDEFGLCLAAARQLAIVLDGINAEGRAYQFGNGLRVYALRKNSAFDILKNRNECFIREGSDRRVYIRGETEMLESGTVRVRPIDTMACWSFQKLRRELQEGLKQRKTAASTVDDQSSRTHAVIEMEIVTKDLLNARDDVLERQSELVPVGKHATDVYIEEQYRAMIQTEDGKYIPNPNYKVNQQRVDAAETKKAEFESRVKEAEEHEAEVFTVTARAHRCIGGRLVFVDLAGAEFLSGIAGTGLKQTPQEKQQGKQINSDLLAQITCSIAYSVPILSIGYGPA
ncbi:hypothetical protein V1525DRAFT_440045 [Lipomyces kononenkoae]|uniref:Uncharacterized protein n=1 Tax=Lipomyces kononenkoae TaxID=34357 RepID=A0ACC3TB48_LIPKO